MFPVPFDDALRLKSLASYNILDTSPEEAFDRLTRLACGQFGTPIALLSLVDGKRQWFKSRQGFDTPETPRDLAFCGHAILSDAPLVVLDTKRDARFRANPLVCVSPGVRFYAGAPLLTCEGYRLGSLCIMDFEPRTDLPSEDIAELQDFAHTAMQMIELRKPVENMQNHGPRNKVTQKQKLRPSLISNATPNLTSLH